MFVYVYFQLPVHKPVVIPLDDSSEEDEGSGSPQKPSASMLLGGLDSFLKAARMSAKVVTLFIWCS